MMLSSDRLTHSCAFASRTSGVRAGAAASGMRAIHGYALRPTRRARPLPRVREGSLTMCGTIAYVGRREAARMLVEGLNPLEYRGYDSAGVAVQNGAGVMVAKLAGRVGALGTLLQGAPLH